MAYSLAGRGPRGTRGPELPARAEGCVWHTWRARRVHTGHSAGSAGFHVGKCHDTVLAHSLHPVPAWGAVPTGPASPAQVQPLGQVLGREAAPGRAGQGHQLQAEGASPGVEGSRAVAGGQSSRPWLRLGLGVGCRHPVHHVGDRATPAPKQGASLVCPPNWSCAHRVLGNVVPQGTVGMAGCCKARWEGRWGI